jgi:hypothetical protein
MSGNLREWEDACVASAGASDPCYARAGAYTDSDINLKCSVAVTHVRGQGAIQVGFRCCADLN